MSRCAGSQRGWGIQKGGGRAGMGGQQHDPTGDAVIRATAAFSIVPCPRPFLQVVFCNAGYVLTGFFVDV